MFGLSLWGKRTVGLVNKGEELETGVPAAWRFHLLLSSSPASPLHPSLQLFPPPPPTRLPYTYTVLLIFSGARVPRGGHPPTHTHAVYCL